MLNSLLQRKGRRSLLSDSIMYFSDEQLFLETGENVLLIFRYSNNTVRTIMYLSCMQMSQCIIVTTQVELFASVAGSPKDS